MISVVLPPDPVALGLRDPRYIPRRLTIDHRVLDGEQGGRFLADLGRVLADPALAFVG